VLRRENAIPCRKYLSNRPPWEYSRKVDHLEQRWPCINNLWSASYPMKKQPNQLIRKNNLQRVSWQTSRSRQPIFISHTCIDQRSKTELPQEWSKPMRTLRSFSNIGTCCLMTRQSSKRVQLWTVLHHRFDEISGKCNSGTSVQPH